MRPLTDYHPDYWHAKTAEFSHQMCCAACGRIFYANNDYAELRAIAKWRPVCSGQCGVQIGQIPPALAVAYGTLRGES